MLYLSCMYIKLSAWSQMFCSVVLFTLQVASIHNDMSKAIIACLINIMDDHMFKAFIFCNLWKIF